MTQPKGKPYRDVFGNPLTKQDVKTAVAIVVRSDNPYLTNLQRQMKVGYGKALRLLNVLYQAGVINGPDASPRAVILKNEEQATNAALRQLKKGKKE